MWIFVCAWATAFVSNCCRWQWSVLRRLIPISRSGRPASSHSRQSVIVATLALHYPSLEQGWRWMALQSPEGRHTFDGASTNNTAPVNIPIYRSMLRTKAVRRCARHPLRSLPKAFNGFRRAWRWLHGADIDGVITRHRFARRVSLFIDEFPASAR